MIENNVGAESQLHNIRESMDFLKRKPTAGVGWMEFIKMTKEEFRADLYKAYVAAGMHDPVLVQEYIKIAESFVFNDQIFTISDSENLAKKITSPSLPNH